VGFYPKVAGAVVAARGFIPIMAAGPAVPASPLDPSYAWDQAYWAENPAWTPPASGANVTVWPDAGALNISLNATNPAPTYLAADPNLGNQPSLSFFSGCNPYNGAAASNLAQPGTVVAVFYFDGTPDPGTAATRTLFDGYGAGPRWFWRMRDGGTQQGLYAGGADVTFGAALAAGSYFVCINFNGAATAAFLNNNAPTTAPSNPGAGTLGTLTVNGNTSQATYGMNGSMAFLGLKGGGGLTPAQITQLRTWARNHYRFF
jgi:hypothetical protein